VNYAEFLAGKQRRHGLYGRPCEASDVVNPALHDWQREGTAWAVRKGRAALWWSTGLGKTRAQIEWARLSGVPDGALIVAPLAVCEQTVREAARIGVEVRYVRDDSEAVGPGTAGHQLRDGEDFDPTCSTRSCWTRRHPEAVGRQDATPADQALRSGASRLACTATPAPNDPEELTNQAEFLGVMPRTEMLAAYFVHDDKGWRMKGHAAGPMYRWMTSWAMALRLPERHRLLRRGLHPAEAEHHPGDRARRHGRPGGPVVPGRHRRRRRPRHRSGGETLAERVHRAVELVKAEPDEPWLLWTGLNDEAAGTGHALPGSVNVLGETWTPEEKAAAYLGFADGTIKYLITEAVDVRNGLELPALRTTDLRRHERLVGDVVPGHPPVALRPEARGHVHAVLSSPGIADRGQRGKRKGRQADKLVDGMVAAMRSEWTA
jgi:hypothetical protein